MTPLTSDERKAGWILSGIALSEGTWCAVNLAAAGPERFLTYLGVLNGNAGPLAWLLALLVAAVYTGFAARIPSIRATLVRPSRLKLLALAVAVTAGVCEEAIFRRVLMYALSHAHRGVVAQVLASALLFGAAHGVWGLIRGSLRAALGAMTATGILGGLLALVFLAGHRVLAPCVVAHLLINALAEPGLVLAAVRGELGAAARAGGATSRDAQGVRARAAGRT